MPRLLPSYLRTLRLQRGLSQPELAALLGISKSLLSKVEALVRRPTAKVMMGAEIVFGRPAREIFPGTFENAEKLIASRARGLGDKLQHRAHRASAEKLASLDEIANRVRSSK